MGNSNELVWHYTSIDAASQILSNGNMRATYYSELNDQNDVKYGLEIAINTLQRLNFKEKLFVDLENKLKDLLENQYKHLWYIMCFTYEDDSIVHWQGYTDHKNGGCAIGFLKKDLKDMLFLDNNKEEFKRSFLYHSVDCIYNKNDANTNFELVLDKYYNAIIYCKNYENSHKIQKEAFEQEYNVMATALYVEVIEKVLASKHNSFKHENEYRLYFQSDEYHNIFFNKSSLKHYIECKFNKDYLSTKISFYYEKQYKINSYQINQDKYIIIQALYKSYDYNKG